ncbi:hypothetical protein GQ44DRAFT_775691 [Phaeosphaeriaceae sp. PMI808]|nr:hypothetical protein GQ44DRAFT_775691 [Phaeosphaeriaceae sp. PMI808]
MFASLFDTQRKHRHARLPREDPEDLDGDTLLPCSPRNAPESPKAGAFDRPGDDTRIVVITLVLSTIFYLGVGLWLTFSIRAATIVFDTDEFCMHHVSRYSPVVKEVKPGWHDKLFNGSFLHQNVYRQSAGSEVDAAWNALGVNYRSVVIPMDEAEETGLRHDQVKISQQYGGGFPGNVEGLHHLHCLNLLRKTLHWNYDHYRAKKEGAFENSEYIVRVHTTHCLDILRQVLMCNPDVGVLGQVWWQPENESKPMPFVDFNTKHRCRDYESIRVWAEEHQLPPEEQMDMSQFYEMPKPGDTVYPEIP